MDDLLVAGKDQKDIENTSIALLNLLAEKGYTVSKKKVQWPTQEVQYLGFVLCKGCWLLHESCLQAISALPTSINVKQLQTFLGISGYA